MPDDSISPAPPPSTAVPLPVAPWPHTAALFALLVGSALLSQRQVSAAPSVLPHVQRYLSGIILTWLLLGSVIAGIYHRRAFITRALRTQPTSLLHESSLGVSVYLFGLLVIAFVGGLVQLTPLAHRHNGALILGMMPHTALEFLAWLCLSLTAGFCEELIFRGYLIDQLTAWTKRPILAIVLSSLLFGSVHLYEGTAAVLPLMSLALLYGFVVRQRKGDLRAVMVAHTLQDFLVAFFAFALPHVHPHP